MTVFPRGSGGILWSSPGAWMVLGRRYTLNLCIKNEITMTVHLGNTELYLPFCFDPLFFSCLYTNALPGCFRSYCLNRSGLIVPDDCWNFEVTSNVLLSGISVHRHQQKMTKIIRHRITLPVNSSNFWYVSRIEDAAVQWNRYQWSKL